MKKTAFTLVELLVVVSIIGVLMAVMVPVLGRAKLIAMVTATNCDLKQIAIGLEMYMTDDKTLGGSRYQDHPPCRTDCAAKWEDHQLPPELVRLGYLPEPDEDGQSTGMEDRFSPGHTYKYWAVGELIQNNGPIKPLRSRLWVPDRFPQKSSTDREQGQWHKDPSVSPVTWVIFSVGPEFDEWQMRLKNYPVPKETWYSPKKRKGIIVRMRLRNEKHIGTFEVK